MAGRGRGRGRGLVISKPPVPGGGDGAEPKVATVEPTTKKESRPMQALSDLKSMLKTALQVQVENGELQEEDVQRVEQLVTVVSDMVETAKVLYGAVKEQRQWVKGMASICERLSNLEADGTQFRSAILRLVQEDYKDRERLKVMSNDDFLSCVAVLSHLFITMRLTNGEVMQPLVGPIFDCLELIIMSDTIGDSEAEVFNNVLLLVGRELQDNADERMQELLISVRTRIIEKKTKPQVRCYLLEVLETYARRWQVAPNDITRFYMDVNMDIYAELAVDQS